MRVNMHFSRKTDLICKYIKSQSRNTEHKLHQVKQSVTGGQWTK